MSPFEELVTRCHAGAFRSAERILRDAHHAADVVQRVYLEALEGTLDLSQAEDPCALMRWVIVRRALSFQTSLQKRGHREMSTDRIEPAVQPDTQPERAEVARQLREAVDALPEDLRTAIVLRYAEGLTLTRVAEALTCPVQTVHSRVQRGLEMLRRRVAHPSTAAALALPENLAWMESAAAPVDLQASLLGLEAGAPVTHAAAQIAEEAAAEGTKRMGTASRLGSPAKIKWMLSSAAMVVATVVGVEILAGERAARPLPPDSRGTSEQSGIETHPAEEVSAMTTAPFDRQRGVARSGVETTNAIPTSGGSSREQQDPGRESLGTVRGRLVAPDEGEITDALVVFVPDPDEADPLMIITGLPQARVASNGSFEIRDLRASNGELVYTARGYAVERMPITKRPSPAGDLGDVTLSAGVTISGQAIHEGSPVSSGSMVIAVAAHYPTYPTLTQRGISRSPDDLDRFGHEQVAARVDAEGRFELRGLREGVRYGLVSVPAENGASPAPFLRSGVPGTIVRAPAQDLKITSSAMTVRILVRSGGLPVSEARIRAERDDIGKHGRTPGWFADTKNPLFTNTDGMLVVSVPRDRETPLEIEALGYRRTQQVVRPSELPFSGVLEVEVERADASASLVLRLPPAASRGFEGASVHLEVRGLEGNDVIGPVVVRNGKARFEGLAPLTESGAVHTMRIRFGFPSDRNLDGLPFEGFSDEALRFDALRPHEERTVDLQAELGGRIALHLVNREASQPAPTFELIGENDVVIRPRLLAARPHGHEPVTRSDQDGPYLLGRSVPPGIYRLRQVGPGYAGSEREVVIQPGAATPLTFVLAPRSR